MTAGQGTAGQVGQGTASSATDHDHDAGPGQPSWIDEALAEHERLEEDETRESLATGKAQFEVRVELPSHHEAVQLGDRLKTEGRTVIRRWTLLVLGTNDSDDANALAEVIKREAPADAKVEVQELGPLIPFGRIGPISYW